VASKHSVRKARIECMVWPAEI
jgi:hypothetical protein